MATSLNELLLLSPQGARRPAGSNPNSLEALLAAPPRNALMLLSESELSQLDPLERLLREARLPTPGGRHGAAAAAAPARMTLAASRTPGTSTPTSAASLVPDNAPAPTEAMLAALQQASVHLRGTAPAPFADRLGTASGTPGPRAAAPQVSVYAAGRQPGTIYRR